MSEHGDIPHVETESSEDMVEEEDFYSESDEVILAPQEPITRKDIRELMQSWEDKFQKMTEGVRALEMSTHDIHTHLDTVTRESRARVRTDGHQQTTQLHQRSPRALHGGIRPSASTNRKYSLTILRTHGDNTGTSASDTSAHAHSTSLAHHEHTYHTAGGTPEFPVGVLPVPCDTGHTERSHARRQSGNQSGNHARR